MGPFKSFEDIPSRYQFAIVVSLRARNLHAGAKPLMPPASRKFHRIAQQEAMAGLLNVLILPPEHKP